MRRLMADFRYGVSDCPPAPGAERPSRASDATGGGRSLWTHLGNPEGWRAISEVGAVEPSDIEGRHGADPSPGSFASAPCPTPCRGTIAGASSQSPQRTSTPSADV